MDWRLIALILLILILIGVLPIYPHSRGWGYIPGPRPFSSGSDGAIRVGALGAVGTARFSSAAMGCTLAQPLYGGYWPLRSERRAGTDEQVSIVSHRVTYFGG